MLLEVSVFMTSNYIRITKGRIDDFFNGTLKKRPLGKPVYVATGREKVAQIPEDWKTQIGVNK